MTTMLRPVDGEPGVFEQFRDLDFIAIELGISAARVEHLISLGNLEADFGSGKKLISLGSARRVLVDMAEELSTWRQEDASVERSDAQRRLRVDSEKTPIERAAEQRKEWLSERASGFDAPVPGAIERMSDEDLLLRTQQKLSLVMNVALHVRDVEELSAENASAFGAACAELSELDIMVEEIRDRYDGGEFVHTVRSACQFAV